ncbi:hypothetical protein HBH98_010090 [Parastagonospora nodorum]|nr:hypothetical protein HBH52_076690 [Parastagonospora nodorum]KAH4007333.1 hypothetical protein HBI10_005570 [Parastagonospora nodorum]KAH4023387.1 hypothetical protein HBI13_087280 [Parastagonospora nodorum]KAH4041084.1 hypothetical protein HBI09_017800 [Parastagonospora nodorum]KAH4133476.1 hypothetical protein HBH47_007870 [Parastagonospora nodorum]
MARKGHDIPVHPKLHDPLQLPNCRTHARKPNTLTRVPVHASALTRLICLLHGDDAARSVNLQRNSQSLHL